MQIKASPNLKAGLAIGTSTIKLFNKCLSKLIIQKKIKMDLGWADTFH